MLILKTTAKTMRLLKFIISVVLVCILFTANAFCPSDTVRLKPIKSNPLKKRIYDAPMVIKTSPTAFLNGGTFPFTAEYRLMAEIPTGRTQSEQFGVSWLGKSVFLMMLEDSAHFNSNEKYKVQGWKVQYAHKIYLIPKRKYAPSGFYFGPLVQYSQTRVYEGLKRYYSKTYYDFHNFNINLIVGLQAAKKKRLTFDMYAGLGYKKNTLYYHATTYRYGKIDPKNQWWYISPYKWPLSVVCGINIGYGF